MFTVAVLGPIEVRRDGTLIPIPAGKATEVLARLALDAGSTVHADRLIEDLWADPAARNTLQSKVSQLRRALGEPQMIRSSHGGYVLDVAPTAVDAVRAVELSAAAAGRRAAGDNAAVLGMATQGLALFRGEVLAGAGDGAWLHPHRARLDEVRLGLLSDQLAARVQVAPGSDVIGELESLVAQHPLHERLWQALITALYLAGRQADALAAYGRVRQALVTELGIEPGRELQELETQVLLQSPTLQAAPAASPSRAPGNLPALFASLLGRASDLAELRALIDANPLVTVVGTAGVGKTRLALEAARQTVLPGGAWLARLDTLNASASSVSIGQAVAEIFGVATEAMLVERLMGGETLIVLDNCEHVVEAAADFATRLLDGTLKVRILVTSQRSLGLEGEVRYTLDPLGIDASVALFADRAAQLRTRFTLDGDAAATVGEICESLDGLPLAIELAAARVRSLSVGEIARRLDDRFTLLRDPTSRHPERRRALGAAISWSYELLFPDDQRGLWALSCFAAGASLSAAEYVLSALGVPAESAVDVVHRLADRSLVTVDTAAAGGARYRLLDSIRAFAAARLAESGHADDAHAAHARWFAAQADRVAAMVRGAAQPRCAEFVRAERADIDAALAWTAEHDPALGLDIANGFGWAWVVLGDGVASAERIRTARAAAQGRLAPRNDIAALLTAGWLEASAGNVAVAEAELDRARELAAGLGDEVLHADAQRHLAFLHLMQARAHDARDMADRSCTVYRRREMTWELAGTLLLGASASMMQSDAVRAVADAQTAVTLMTPIGDSWVLVHAEAMLGAIAQATHRFGDAAGHLHRAAADSDRLGFAGQAAYHRTRLGRVQHQAGDRSAAADTLADAVDAAVRCGDLRMAATARVHWGRVLRDRGKTDDALALLHDADDWFRGAGGGDGALLARVLLASTSAADDAPAAHDLDALLDQARQNGDPEVEVLTLDLLARLSAVRGDRDRATGLLDAADALTPMATQIVDAVDRVDAHAARAVLRH